MTSFQGIYCSSHIVHKQNEDQNALESCLNSSSYSVPKWRFLTCISGVISPHVLYSITLPNVPLSLRFCGSNYHLQFFLLNGEKGLNTDELACSSQEWTLKHCILAVPKHQDTSITPFVRLFMATLSIIFLMDNNCWHRVVLDKWSVLWDLRKPLLHPISCFLLAEKISVLKWWEFCHSRG